MLIKITFIDSIVKMRAYGKRRVEEVTWKIWEVTCVWSKDQKERR